MDKIKNLFSKYKEYILYVIFGVVTTIVGWGVFYLCDKVIGMGVVPSNVISWIMAVAVAYITNRKWVFRSTAAGLRSVAKEAISFAAGRLITLAVETLILWVSVDICGWDDMLMKILATIVVLVLNYLFSKLFVFARK